MSGRVCACSDRIKSRLHRLRRNSVVWVLAHLDVAPAWWACLQGFPYSGYLKLVRFIGLPRWPAISKHVKIRNAHCQII